MNEHNYNTSIEKSVLSSILFNPILIEDIDNIIDVKDFYLPAHQEIYSTMQFLYKNDLPIDEEFIKRKSKKLDENAMLEILSANPISNITQYAKEMIKDGINRQITSVGNRVSHGDLSAINELVILQDRLNAVDGIKKLKQDDKTFMSIFDKFDINFEEIENVKFEYLMDNFLVKNEITMISAKPGTGKSLLSVAAANMMILQKKIDHVFYIDGDNSKSTLKDRNIHHLKKQHGNKFRYFVGLGKNELWQIINTLKKMDLTNYLVVFDSIKNFIAGDRDKNKDVSPVMEILKTLRNNGATVIFLHHQNKGQKDFESDYAGSSAFAEDTSNAFTLKRNDDKNSLILKPFKARAGDLHEIAFSYNAHNHTLSKLELGYAKQTKEMDEMINETIEYLKSSRNRPMWSELQKNLTDLGYDKEKASKVIKNNEGKLWNFERGDRNNQKLYSLIPAADKKAVTIETLYEDIINTTPRSQITPSSLFLGTSESLELDTNRSDNSEKSSETQNSEYIAPITPRTFKIGVFEDLNVVSDKSENSEKWNGGTNNMYINKSKIEMPIL